MEEVDDLIVSKIDYIAELYRDIETNVIVEIAKMIKTKGYITATGKYELEALQRIVGIDKSVLEQLQRMSGKPMSEVIKSLEEIGISSIDYDLFRTSYKRGLLEGNIDTLNVFSPIVAIQNALTQDIKKFQTVATQNTIKGYRKALDIASMNVSLGITSPDKAIVQAVRDIAKQGITSATYIGKNGNEINQSLETVVTRHVRTQFIAASNETSHYVGEELGVEHWYITQHLGARNTWREDEWEDHESWQGLVVDNDELFDKCGFREMLGLGGINCRHRHYAFIKGVSVPPPPKVDKEDNDLVTKLITKQRAYERSIKESKRIIMSLEALGDIEDAKKQIVIDKNILKKRQARLRNFIKDNDKYLKRNYSRERVII